ncbi:MAG TPA: GNAT family N-acetyltransferase [Rugosimonospora sp.]|nr:GNAT family N-acetyltransferase [Rugosimonospora sp.]
MPIDTALATLAEETIWQGCAAYGPAAGVEVGDRWYLTGFDYPDLNGAFPVDEAVDVAAALAPFQQRRVPMVWHLGPRAPDRLVPRLRAAGCVYDHQEPLMVAELDRPAPPARPVPGLRIVEAVGAERLADFARVWSGHTDEAVLAGLVRLRAAAGPAFTHLIGLLDGVPVACAAAFHGPDASEVQHVVTVRPARRRGVGTGLTVRLLQLIRERGAGTAVLTASPYGERLYQRLGFRPVGAIRRYRWRPGSRPW